MAYVMVEEANVTTLDQARPGDALVALVTVNGKEALTLAASITDEPAQVVGRCYEDARGDVWYALKDKVIRQFGPDRPRRMSDEARRVCGLS